MGRPRKAQIEGAAYTAPDQGDVVSIRAGVELFKARFPDEWEAMRLCPLQHGLEEMERLLGGKA
jgi:hypothetical protein